MISGGPKGDVTETAGSWNGPAVLLPCQYEKLARGVQDKEHGRTIHWVKGVALFNRRLPVIFRYAPIATEIARRRNMSRRANSRSETFHSIAFVSASPQRRWHRTTESVWPSDAQLCCQFRTRSTLALFEHFQRPVGVHGHYQLAADHPEHGQVGIDHERYALQRHHRNPPPDPELACDHLIAVR